MISSNSPTRIGTDDDDGTYMYYHSIHKQGCHAVQAVPYPLHIHVSVLNLHHIKEIFILG